MVKKKSFFALVNFFTIVKSCMERKENELSGWVCHSWYGIYSLVTLQKLCKYCSHPEWFLVTVQIFEIHIRPQNLKNIQLSFDIYLVTSKIREIFFSNFCGLQFKHYFHSTIPYTGKSLAESLIFASTIHNLYLAHVIEQPNFRIPNIYNEILFVLFFA